MLRKMLCCLLCCIAILSLTATSVFASGDYGYFNGSDEPASIRFDFSGGEIPVTGGKLQLRQIAYWDDTAKSLAWCEGYAEAGLSIRQPFTDDSAAWLYVFAEKGGLPARDVEIGADGKAVVENLDYGFYLVSQIEPFEGYTVIRPALISVPMEINHTWIFDVEAMPKLEPLVPETSETTETTVPSTTEPTTDIPRTGQVNWPVPILLLAGSVLMILGLCLRKEKRHET